MSSPGQPPRGTGSAESRPRLLFVTGTDTHVGKTVWSCWLVRWLRSHGVRTGAMKPVSTGDRSDALNLFAAVDGEQPLEQINPFHYSLPAAPWVAARSEGRRVEMGRVVREVRRCAAGWDVLVVEGVGGLCVPLSARRDTGDLLAALRPDGVFVVARNRLGVINHVTLTLRELARRCPGTRLSVVLMGAERREDAVIAENAAVLSEIWKDVGLVEMPFVRAVNRCEIGVEALEKEFKKPLAQNPDGDILTGLFGRRVAAAKGPKKKSKKQLTVRWKSIDSRHVN